MRAAAPSSVAGVNETVDGLLEAVARAADYVQGYGTPFELARLSAILPPAFLRKVGQAYFPASMDIPQNADGGWPAAWSDGASSLDSTCFQLDRLADFATPPPGADVPAAVTYLVCAQQDDGTWREEPSHRSTPGWLVPGSAAARVYLTANCASALIMHHGPAVAVERAAQALERSLDPHGRLPGPLVAHWLGARALRATGRDLAARRLLDVVGRSFGRLDPVGLAWFGSALPQADRWTRRIAARLIALQQADGSWAGESPIGEEDGKPSADLTVTACRVLLRA